VRADEKDVSHWLGLGNEKISYAFYFVFNFCSRLIDPTINQSSPKH